MRTCDQRERKERRRGRFIEIATENTAAKKVSMMRMMKMNQMKTKKVVVAKKT